MHACIRGVCVLLLWFWWGWSGGDSYQRARAHFTMGRFLGPGEDPHDFYAQLEAFAMEFG